MSDDQPPSRSFLARLRHKFVEIFQSTPRDRESLIAMLREAEARTLLNPDALSMLEGVLQVSEMQARDIMIPRPKMVVLDLDDSIEDILNIVITSSHSRFPVIGESRDDIVGVLLAKDLLNLYVKAVGRDSVARINIRDSLRPAVIIPESKRLDVLLKDFRSKRNHMAMIVDEYGSISGLVTIEDVLEQIVGEIEDETDIDTDEDNINQIDINEYNIKALTDIEDFNEYFGTQFADDEVDTVGGLVTQAFGHLPKPGESVEIKPFEFTVLNADNRRIRQLKAIKLSDD
ncbi:MAG TPA: CBS domain-containing protein [Aeromonadales bacterium]|nr:CBS domain-containing protein [Aeromonadales bacterium]